MKSDKDIEKLKKLWKEIFHDSDEYINLFFDNYFNPETSLWIEDKDRVVAMMSGVEYIFVDADKRKFRGLYLCGLATLPEYRKQGIMSKMISMINHMAALHGYDFTFLIPADENLRAYYARIGYENTMKERRLCLNISYAKKLLREADDVNVEFDFLDDFDSYILDEIYMGYINSISLIHGADIVIKHSRHDLFWIIKEKIMSGDKIILCKRNRHISSVYFWSHENVLSPLYISDYYRDFSLVWKEVFSLIISHYKDKNETNDEIVISINSFLLLNNNIRRVIENNIELPNNLEESFQESSKDRIGVSDLLSNPDNISILLTKMLDGISYTSSMKNESNNMNVGEDNENSDYRRVFTFSDRDYGMMYWLRYPTNSISGYGDVSGNFRNGESGDCRNNYLAGDCDCFSAQYMVENDDSENSIFESASSCGGKFRILKNQKIGSREAQSEDSYVTALPLDDFYKGFELKRNRKNSSGKVASHNLKLSEYSRNVYFSFMLD